MPFAAPVKPLRTQIDAIKHDYPPIGRLALTGHAHIDLAWLWPVAETRRKNRRTFTTVLMLMDRYDDFTFNQSSAQVYAWLEEDDPDLFERIKQRVAEGRWELIGGIVAGAGLQGHRRRGICPPDALRAALFRADIRQAPHASRGCRTSSVSRPASRKCCAVPD